MQPFIDALEPARARLRRRDGHDAVREGRVHQQELRRAEPDAARARVGSASGVRARRRRHHRDQHVRRQPRSSSGRSVWPTGCTRSTSKGANRARAAPARTPTSPARSDRSASASSRGARPASTRRASIFREQAQALLDGGVDLFILETFRDLNEIGAAIDAVRDRVRPADRRADDDRGGRQHARRHAARAVCARARAARRDGHRRQLRGRPGADARDDRADGGRDRAAPVGAAERRQAARRRRAQHLSVLARVHGVVRAPLHPAQRAASSAAAAARRRSTSGRSRRRSAALDAGVGARSQVRPCGPGAAARPAVPRSTAAPPVPREQKSRLARELARGHVRRSASSCCRRAGFDAEPAIAARPRAEARTASTSSTFRTASAPARG